MLTIHKLAAAGVALVVICNVAVVSLPRGAGFGVVGQLSPFMPAGLTLALYVAFPKRRRSDLLGLAIAAELLVRVGRALLQVEPISVSGFSGVLIGPALVHGLSHVEALRAAARRPRAEAFQLTSLSRRRSATRSRTAQRRAVA